jgi:acetyl-CoA carboxylase carboxyl transferase subunit alpha
VVIGEGGSGGALGIGVGDKVAMFRHAFYSVISPEGCAAILWKTAEHRKHAAEALKLTAPELLKLELIDDIIAEPLGGAHRDPESAAASLEKYLVASLGDLKRLTTESLVHRRQQRIRSLGCFFEEPAAKVADIAKEPRRTRRITTRTSRLTRIPG